MCWRQGLGVRREKMAKPCLTFHFPTDFSLSQFSFAIFLNKTNLGVKRNGWFCVNSLTPCGIQFHFSAGSGCQVQDPVR
jgi:hypothetical protein